MNGERPMFEVEDRPEPYRGPERRSGKERRQGSDRREEFRFDLTKEDRRSGKDRRRQGSWNGSAIDRR